MCFHNSMSKKAQRLAARYGRLLNAVEIAEKIIQEQYHVSAFTNPEYPIITSDPEVQVYNWGLIPFWAKTEKAAEEIRTKTYNARSESIFNKPSFRSSIKTCRCIVPSTGWFDWRHEDGKKIPYFIYLKDLLNNDGIFSMAGIHAQWTNPDTGRSVYTFSIITTEANELMSYIHNTNFRMPVILHKEDEEKWLYPELKDNDIKSLMKPFEDDLMDAYIINNNFLKKNPHDPSIIKPLSA